MKSSQKLLVTGGAGFIGSHVVDSLLERGCEVIVLDIKTKEEAVNLCEVMGKITYVEGDIRDVGLVERLTKKSTHILHLAAVVSVPESIKDPSTSHDVNTTGTANVFEAARCGDVKRVVYASSAAVYGDVDVVPTGEESSKQPQSPYGLQKYVNEQYAKLYSEQFGLETVGLRLFNVFGSRQDPSSPYSGVISIFVKKLKNNESIKVHGDGSATRDFVHVSDVVQACLLALFDEKGSGEVFNVGSGHQTSINELIKTLEEVFNIITKVEYGSPREGDVLNSCSLIEKIQKTFDYKVDCDFKSGIKEILK